MTERAKACPFSTDPDATKEKGSLWGKWAFKPYRAPWVWAWASHPLQATAEGQNSSQLGFSCIVFFHYSSTYDKG